MTVRSDTGKKLIIIGPNVSMGGVERASSNLANALVKKGLKVHYLALIPKTPFFSLDVAVHYEEPVGFNKQHLHFLKTILFVRKYILREKPDFIIGFTKLYAALANLSLWLSPYQLVLSERSSPLYRWPKHIEWFCRISYTLKRPAGVISQTSTAAAYHQQYYRNVPNMVIPNALREIKTFPHIQRKKWILGVGRFHDACKGFDRLVKAFGLLRNTEWQLVFAGGTREEGRYLLDLVPDQAVQNRIEFLGSVKEIDRVYAQAGIFVIPSRSEGFPNALCEAMAAGLPCISFDFISGPRDLIEDGKNGFIVEEGNLEKLADKIDYLIAHEKVRRRIGQNAKSIMGKLDENRVSDMVNNFMEKLYSNR